MTRYLCSVSYNHDLNGKSNHISNPNSGLICQLYDDLPSKSKKSSIAATAAASTSLPSLSAVRKTLAGSSKGPSSRSTFSDDVELVVKKVSVAIPPPPPKSALSTQGPEFDEAEAYYEEVAAGSLTPFIGTLSPSRPSRASTQIIFLKPRQRRRKCDKRWCKPSRWICQ